MCLLDTNSFCLKSQRFEIFDFNVDDFLFTHLVMLMMNVLCFSAEILTLHRVQSIYRVKNRRVGHQ